MKIKTTYVGTLNGINGMWCGFKPDGVEIIEEREVLFAKDGYDLIRIADEENMGANVWLRPGDLVKNYREEEHVEPEPPMDN